MIMKKQIFAALAFILALCSNALTASAATITPTGNQVWWGYFNESDFAISDNTIGTGSPMALMAAIYVPANHEELGNATIKAIRVYAKDEVVSSLSDFTVFISQSLPASISAADYKLPVKDAIVGGANDVMLATPYAVNNNGFYVGYYVNSTTGYFIRTGGTGVENSFFIGNPEIEMQWGDYSLQGLGKLALQILVEGGNFKDYSATAEDFKPTVVGLGNTVNVPVTVKGMGTNTINSLSYTVTADGNTTEEKTLDNLTIAYGQKQVVDFPVDAAATVGKHTTTITITKVNGNVNEATKNTATGDITTVETLTTWPRNVLIEEFTTEKCVYCPQAASGLASFLKNYPDLAERVAVACHHDGYYTDWLTIAASSSYCWFYNDPAGTYAPAFMYDRYAGDDYTPVVSREANAAGYKKRVEDRLAVDSYANIDLSASFNEDKTQINVTADCERGWDFCSTPSRITLFLTEDNIKAHSQSGATGTFTHQHVLRAVNETWGTVLEWNENKAAYTYTFTLDEAWKKEDLKVVAFISAYDSTDPTACTVENTAVVVPAGEDVDAINDVNTKDTTPAAYYNLDGTRLNAPTKGINIVRMSNGTIRKVLVK